MQSYSARWLLAAALCVCEVASFETLDINDAHARWQAGVFSVVVDVRRPEEFEGLGTGSNSYGHVEGSFFAESMGSNEIIPPELDGCKDCSVALICRTGRRTKEAAAVLESANFTRVYDILGVTQWTDAGYPLVKGAWVPTIEEQCQFCRTGEFSPPSPPPTGGDDDDNGGTNAALIGGAVGGAVGGIVLVGLVAVRRTDAPRYCSLC